MGFGWKPRIEGLTWESLDTGDVLISHDQSCAILILGTKDNSDHIAINLMTGKIQGVRGDDAHIGPEMWEVYRAP